MQSKILIFTIGAACGAIGVFFLPKSNDTDSEPQSQPFADSTPPRIPLESEQKKITRLKEKIAQLEADNSQNEVAPKSSGVVKVFGGDGNSQIDLAEIQKQIAKGESDRAEKQIESRLATLTKNLNLTDAQIASVREFLEEEAQQKGGISQLLGAAFSGNGVEATRTLVSPSDADPDLPSFEEKLRSLLDDDQNSAYEKYLTAQNENSIEASANGQLSQLQTAIPDLSKEQKDQAFNEFARISREDIETHGSPSGKDGMSMDFSRLMAEQKARKNAMKEILTPEQMAVYETQNSGNTFTLGGGSGSNIIGAGITIDSSEIIIGDPGDSTE